MIARAQATLKRIGLWPMLLGFATLFSSEASASSAVQLVQRGEFTVQIGPAPDWVVQSEVASVWDPALPGASETQWRNWLVDDQAYRLGGQRVRYTDRAYEPVAAEMVSEAGKIEVTYTPEFQTLTIHEVSLRRDGVWSNRLNPERITLARRESDFEADMSTGAVSAMLLLDDVRANDVIRVSHTIAGRNPILAGLDSEQATFGWGSPILDRRFRALFEANVDITEFRDGALPAASIAKHKDHQEWKYRSHGIAETTFESGQPAWYTVLPYVVLSEKRRWHDVATWAAQLYPKPKPLPADLEKRITAWQALPTQTDRVTAALTAVQEEVRYFGAEIGENTHKPAEPADVWTRRRGDCKDKSRLLVAILDKMGIQANPALVNSEVGEAIAKLPPAASVFDHVIVQVHDGKRSLWLDPTRTQQRGPATAQDVGEFGFALPVTPQARKLVSVERNPDFVDRIDAVEEIKLDTDGLQAALTVRTAYAGASANQFRLQLATTGNEAIQRRYEELYRRRYGDLTATAKLEVSDEPTKNLVTVTERYKLLDPWAASTPALRRIDFYADHIASIVELPTTMSRKTPLATVHPFVSSHRVELQLPTGWAWQGEEDQETLEDLSGTVSIHHSQKQGLVIYEHQFQSKTSVVDVDHISDHLRWRREVSDRIAPRIVVALPIAAAKLDRDSRLQGLIRDAIEESQQRNKRESDNE